MAGNYGNDNLWKAESSAFIDYAGASEVVTLPVGTTAVTLVATTKCWVYIGDAGETAVAAAPSAEKVWKRKAVPVNIGYQVDLPVDVSTDGALVQIAVIQDSAAGVLDVIARKE